MTRNTRIAKSKSLAVLEVINLIDYCDELQNVPSDEADEEMEKCQNLYDIENARILMPLGGNVECHKSNELLANPNDSLVYADNPLESIPDAVFESTYGFRKQSVLNILNDIAYGWSNRTQRGCPKSPIHSLLITLNYLVNGTLASVAPTCPPVSQSTLSRILAKVTGLLAELRTRFIKVPTSKHELESIKRKFETLKGFPMVIGCVGSTHIAIRTPSKTVSDDFLNEFGYHSYRFSAICGFDMEFYEVTSRWPGASNENNIFHLSEFNQLLETNGKSIALANNRYAGIDFVMTPVENVNKTTDSRYNEAHAATYNFPQAMALFMRRFQCLRTVLKFKDGECVDTPSIYYHILHIQIHLSLAETIQTIIAACAVLHNIAIAGNEPLPTLNSEIEPIRCVSTRTVPPTPVLSERAVSNRECFILEHFGNA